MPGCSAPGGSITVDLYRHRFCACLHCVTNAKAGHGTGKRPSENNQLPSGSTTCKQAVCEVRAGGSGLRWERSRNTAPFGSVSNLDPNQQKVNIQVWNSASVRTRHKCPSTCDERTDNTHWCLLTGPDAGSWWNPRKLLGGREHLLFYWGNSGWAPGGTVTRETKPRLEAWNSQPCSPLLFSKKGSRWSEWSPRSMWWSLQKIPKMQGPELPGGQTHPHPGWVSEWKSLSCVWLCDPMDYTAHGILQARILEWVAFPLSRGSSQPRDQTQVSHIAGEFFTSSMGTERLYSRPPDLTLFIFSYACSPVPLSHPLIIW